jgi:HD-like signal output (HDOD) protein
MVRMPPSRKNVAARLSVAPHHSSDLVSRASGLSLPGEAEFPCPPALTNSLLQLELRLSEFVTDLDEVTNIIRSDFGLTAQLLRLAAHETERSSLRLATVSEMVIGVGIERMKGLVTRTQPLAGHFKGVSSFDISTCNRFWMRCRLTALVAEELASRFSEICTEEAYMAGLLFHLGELPSVLGWTSGPSTANYRHIGYRMAKAWGFPRVLVDVIGGDRDLCLRKSRVLLDLVTAADAWAARVEFLAARESAQSVI